MNYEENCRTCLGNDKEMRNIYSTVLISGSDVQLAEILNEFYKYETSSDDGLPQNLCISCVHQLTITYSFKLLIQSTHSLLTEDTNMDSNFDTVDAGFSSDVNNDMDYVPPLKETKVRPKLKHRAKIKKNMKIKKVLYCIECKHKFHSVGLLHDHYTKNHEIKSTVGRECEYCSERIEEFRSLILHRKKHLRPYVCDLCWLGFFNIDDMNTHSCQPKLTREDRNKIEKVLRQCDQCGKSYPPSYIKIHMRTHSEDRPYHCKYCPKKFKVPGCLHSHVLWNHKRTRNHRCETCNATFISSSARSSHIRKNHLKEKKYVCKCGKRFFSKSELERHDLTHTGVKNYHCHLCDKSYQTRYGLNVHLKSHSQMNMLSL